MDKDHLIELISNSLLYESKDSDSTKNLSDFRNYLENLNPALFFLIFHLILFVP